MADLLIELFSEEIPARMQGKAADDLKKMVTGTLKEAGLTFDAADAYSTPRRLALNVTNLPAATPDISEERRGPRVDAPEKALEGFMRGAGVTRDQLEEREEKKGTFFFAKIEKPGRAATEVIAEAVENAVRNFPWPKSQRWGSGSLKWVRPLHSILCVLGGETVELEVEGYRAGNTTRGHRFMAPDEFTVTDFADYKAKLLEHKVVLDATRRETLIYDTAQTLAQAAGLELVEDRGLLTEVAGLVEWPVPMIGAFDPAFLEVPEEVLILTMRKDQKYFVTRDPATGKLANKFIFTANLEPSDDGSAVTNGNQRVVSARLADAKFFWDQDLKRKLDDNLPALKEIVFHKDLGMVSDRVERMKKLARHLAEFIPGCDADEAERAAELAKADLVSNMVYEFPEVQGAMGRYYAQKQGETDAVADAIRDHYAPAGPSDACPSAPVSIAVALAEKLDTLAGFFFINQKPTGSKDPFALRRAALGTIRLIVENNLRVSLDKPIYEALILVRETIRKNAQLEVKVSSSRNLEDLSIAIDGLEADIEYQADALQQLLRFFGDRLKVAQREKGVRHDLISSVFSRSEDGEKDVDMVRILTCVVALSTFLATDDGTNLLAGYKRAANILKAEEKKEGKAFDASVDASKFELTEEKALGEALVSAKAGASEALEAEDFEKAMSALSTLRAPIDAFFDKVIVNADDADVRANRLSLLTEIRAAVNTVADFGLIEG
ncbi:glycine--tRNA ligase subunit beta [Kordiimonas laminariae]|uniref:glycine--tRNA ligase subunit beta n=1 Tax=Kordiimonas laminariae TaxID=2917717 RepID=UPI001FF63B1D|nr:glycine--tRNA ligase subunit beta [Kordiimonas laminariae]MCK0068631.1 glycine--tRNA ligase subunit beta [Kordiimonas laminariae]